MSYFEDQEECWEANGYKGSPSDYDPYDADNWPGSHSAPAPNDEERKLLAKLQRAAENKGLKCSCHGNGHFQIRSGRRIINWYPYSKKQTAFDNITGEKKRHLTLEQVLAFALETLPEESIAAQGEQA